MYRRTKKPLESCQYYERAGHFEKAIDVLLEHKQFENAIHALNRYERLKKVYIVITYYLKSLNQCVFVAVLTISKFHPL